MFALDTKTMQRIAPVVRRVLIVDPNPAAARLLSDLLKGFGSRDVAVESDEARVIDLEKSRRHPLRVMCTLRDLHSLNYYSQSVWSRTDRLRFLEKYLGIPRLNGYAKWLWHSLESRFGKKRHAHRGGQ